MVLFTIACETCASRLSVKQQGAIGQVLACPKCGSMVHVQPPEGWEPPAPEPAVEKPRPPRDPDDSQATLSGEFGNLREGTRSRREIGQPADKRTSSTTPAKKTSPVSSTPPVQDAVDVNAENHWQADGSAQRGKGLAWISGIIGICLVAFVLILYMVSQMMNGNEAVAEKNGEGNSSKQSAAENDPENDPENEGEQSTPAEGEGNGKEPAEGATDSANAVTDAENTKDDPDESTDGDPNDSGDETAASGEAANAGDGDSMAENPDANNDQSTDSVLDEEAALRNNDAPSGDPVTLDTADADSSIIDEFADVGDLIFEPGIDSELIREVADDDQTHKYGIGQVYVPVPRSMETDTDQALAEVYPGLAFKDQPLIEFSRNLFHLTQIPVQLDAQSIELGLLDPQTPISAAGSSISVNDLLEQALTPLDLTWNRDESGSIIVISANQSDEIVAQEISLAEVLEIDSDEKIQRMIEGIQMVIDPPSWNSEGGPGSIRIEDGKIQLEHTLLTGTRIKHLLTKLELAAKLKSAPGNPEVATEIATTYQRSRDRLTSKGTVHEIQLMPIQAMLKRLSEQEGLTILVDWIQAGKKDWNPQVQIPWISKRDAQSEPAPVEETLWTLANSMELAIRLLDEDTVLLTSKVDYWNETRVEVYPCSKQLEKGYSPDQLIEFLKQGIGADLPKQNYSAVVFSPQYDCIIANLPDPLHIRVETILNELAESD